MTESSSTCTKTPIKLESLQSREDLLLVLGKLLRDYDVTDAIEKAVHACRDHEVFLSAGTDCDTTKYDEKDIKQCSQVLLAFMDTYHAQKIQSLGPYHGDGVVQDIKRAVQIFPNDLDVRNAIVRLCQVEDRIVNQVLVTLGIQDQSVLNASHTHENQSGNTSTGSSTMPPMSPMMSLFDPAVFQALAKTPNSFQTIQVAMRSLDPTMRTQLMNVHQKLMQQGPQALTSEDRMLAQKAKEGLLLNLVTLGVVPVELAQAQLKNLKTE